MELGLGIFAALVIITTLGIDLGIAQRNPHSTTLQGALIWTVAWIALALVFNVIIYLTLGATPAIQFLSSYLVEKSLSVDNLFVFLLVFSYFRIPREFQHKILFWGIVGAVVFRAILIYAGVELISRYHWLTYLLGFFLLVTALKTAGREDEEPLSLNNNRILRTLRRYLPVSSDFHGGQFLVRRKGQLIVTPLFIVLAMIETTDVLFALDSIPAVLGITRDTLILCTSNLFAILGLRALYFVLEGLLRSLRYLSAGVSLILGFVGLKMIVADLYHVREAYTLCFIATVLLCSGALSLLRPLKPIPNIATKA